jgi:sulfoxide reductase heme-binding subunit YedZ
MLATTTGTQFFWITSRAAGTVALILASAAVGVGVSISGRLSRRRGQDLRVTHEALSLAALVAILLHASLLLGDRWFHPSVADLAVPFVSGYRSAYMAIGIIAGWGMLVTGLSYYARARIGVARWKVLHRATALAWLLGVVHALGEGSDAGRAWFVAMVVLAVGPALTLLALRLRGGPRAAGRLAGTSGPRPDTRSR